MLVPHHAPPRDAHPTLPTAGLCPSQGRSPLGPSVPESHSPGHTASLPLPGEAPLLPAAADVPHRRGSVLPPGCGAVRRMIPRRANLRDTVTQREALQHQRGQRLARGVTLARSHSRLPALTGTGSSWVKTGIKTHRGLPSNAGIPSRRIPVPLRGADEEGWDGVGRDGTRRDGSGSPCASRPSVQGKADPAS